MLEFDAEKILFDKMGGFLNIKAILWLLHLVNDS